VNHLLTAVVILLAQAVPVNPLVGLWESDVKSKGGIGTAMEFRSDGTYTMATTVLVDAFYRVVRDRLVIGDQPPAVDADTTVGLPAELPAREIICAYHCPETALWKALVRLRPIITSVRLGRSPSQVSFQT
jgi:hypothetical protein